jgi:adenylate kinase
MRDNNEGKQERRFALILLGPPGSGKGTQAKLLAEHFGLPHISSGDLLRDYIQADGRAREIKAVMRSGNLVPDDLVNQLVARRIAQPDCVSGFILDGYPRTLPQAQTLLQLLEALGIHPVVVHFKLDDGLLLVRLTGRQQCPRCGTVYNLIANPPKSPGRCDKDGAVLVFREDDWEPVIRKRVEAYEKETRKIQDYFEKQGAVLRDIDVSQGGPQEIAARIIRSIEETRAFVPPIVERGAGHV